MEEMRSVIDSSCAAPPDGRQSWSRLPVKTRFLAPSWINTLRENRVKNTMNHRSLPVVATSHLCLIIKLSAYQWNSGVSASERENRPISPRAHQKFMCVVTGGRVGLQPVVKAL